MITQETAAYGKNLVTYSHWIDQLAQLAISSIEWDVPDTIDPIRSKRHV